MKAMTIIIAVVVVSIIGLRQLLTLKDDAHWITISYASLLPQDAIIRTGNSLASALHDPAMKGAVQPFVDFYSELLPSVLEMTAGPDKIPQHHMVTYFFY